tara:strand:- start:1644 stop:2300 length:657 start_codon:yes stop_codon:yes gene_type:complete
LVLTSPTGLPSKDENMHDLVDIILPIAASPWIYVVVILFVIIDGVLPLFPSEATVVGLAALASSTDGPNLVLLLLAATVGAVVGDNTAFVLGRRLRRRSANLLGFRAVARLLEWTSHGLERRPSSFVLVARFIPMARLAVNITAGMEEFPYSRFLPLCVMASAAWATYNVAIGISAGRWFEDNPLLGMGIAIAVAIFLGWVLDITIARLLSRGKTIGG